jgi:hypothetical protein
VPTKEILENAAIANVAREKAKNVAVRSKSVAISALEDVVRRVRAAVNEENL